MKKWLALMGCMLFMSHGKAFSDSQDFTYKGEPIEPNCIAKFFGDSSSYDPIHLDRDPCQVKKHALDPHPPKGLMGYATTDGGYIYYEHLGTIPLEDVKQYLSKNHLKDLKDPFYHLVYYQWSGGGTGHFTSIDVVEKSGNTLKLIDSITGGDRCNGGISDVVFKDGILTYKKNVTPWALYTLIYGNSPVNFSDCAICCMGQVSYQGSSITSFTFAHDGVEALPVEPGLPQGCYNQIIKLTLAEGKKTLTLKELKSFIQKIKEHCVDKKTLSAS